MNRWGGGSRATCLAKCICVGRQERSDVDGRREALAAVQDAGCRLYVEVREGVADLERQQSGAGSTIAGLRPTQSQFTHQVGLTL